MDDKEYMSPKGLKTSKFINGGNDASINAQLNQLSK